MKLFSEMQLDNGLVEALRRMNFTTATEVQEQAIPVALQGKDVIVRAKTGTGKTYAFMLPILHMITQSNYPEALIIAPTRELAVQITAMARKVDYRHAGITVVYGGASINVQIQELRRNPRIVIGTPGRILDLIERGELVINRVRFVVLDEADIMLDMGFIDDVDEILSMTPKSKQTMLFSATIPDSIMGIARRHMHDPVSIKVGEEDELVVNTIKHYFAMGERRDKAALLLAYIKKYNPKKAIIFAQTKHAADMIYELMKAQGHDVILMHGGLTQAKREHSLGDFRRGARFMIATNVAARGLDIAGISDVINFDIPEDPYVYVHRVGRSARMNADGRSFTIISTEERDKITEIKNVANIDIEELRIDTAEFRGVQLFGRSGYRGHGDRGDRGGRDGRPGMHGGMHGRDRGRGRFRHDSYKHEYKGNFMHSRR
jgi:ATP-dependent RNA helicase DeaD